MVRWFNGTGGIRTHAPHIFMACLISNQISYRLSTVPYGIKPHCHLQATYNPFACFPSSYTYQIYQIVTMLVAMYAMPTRTNSFVLFGVVLSVRPCINIQMMNTIVRTNLIAFFITRTILSFYQLCVILIFQIVTCVRKYHRSILKNGKWIIRKTFRNGFVLVIFK